MDSISTLAVYLLVLSSLWGLLYWSPRRKIWAAGRLIPGPKPLPFFGNSTIFWGDVGVTLGRIVKLRQEYGPVVRAWLGGRLMVMISDPEDIKCVLGNARIRNRDRNFALALLPFFGNGLLSNKDDVWKVHRKLISPMFHFKVLESYAEIFGAKAMILMDKLGEVADGRTFNIYKKLSLCTLDAICETAIGMATNTQEEGFSKFQDVLYNASNLVHRRALYPWLLNTWLYPLTRDGREAKTIIKSMDAFSRDVISRKLEEYRRGVRRAGIATASGKVVTSFLDMLIEASEAQGSILSEQEMQDEVITMAAAGLDTTGITMSFFLLLVAIHSEWQDALFTELSDVFADDMTRPARHQDFPKMPILERVIRETLRLFPIASMLPRDVSEDVVLPSGYTLPAGCSCAVVTYTVHRDEKNYPEPNKFLPDRWLPGYNGGQHPYAYLPFSAGPRNCVGQKYALFQMKVMLSQLLRRFKVTTDLTMDDIEKLEMNITLGLGPEGYLLQLEERSGANRVGSISELKKRVV